jgi:hypothetical protein
VLESSKQRKRAVIVLEEMLAVSPRETALNFNILLNACAKVSSCSASITQHCAERLTVPKHIWTRVSGCSCDVACVLQLPHMCSYYGVILLSVRTKSVSKAILHTAFMLR